MTASRRVSRLAAAFVIAQLADVVTTAIALSSGRYAEANPAFARLFSAGLWLGLALKGGAALLILGAVLWVHGRSRWLGVAALAVLVVLSSVAPVANAAELLR